MVTANTALAGISSAFALVWAFWTGTINVIFGFAATQYQAFIYVVGLFLIIGVPVYQMFSRKRIIDISRRNVALVLLLALVVQPFVIQGQYNPDDMTLFQPIASTNELLIAESETLFGYYNTSGNWISASIVETQVANGSWTVTLSATAQDLDKKARVSVFLKSSGVVSPYWNSTAWDQDTTDGIVAYSVRITAGTDGYPVTYQVGWSGHATILGNYDDNVIYTSDSLSTVPTTAAQYALIDEYEDIIAGDMMAFGYQESDASQFVDAAVVEIELHFYSSVAIDTFNEYMLYCGLLNVLIAGAMTKYWNPTGRRRRRRR